MQTSLLERDTVTNTVTISQWDTKGVKQSNREMEGRFLPPFYFLSNLSCHTSSSLSLYKRHVTYMHCLVGIVQFPNFDVLTLMVWTHILQISYLIQCLRQHNRLRVMNNILFIFFTYLQNFSENYSNFWDIITFSFNFQIENATYDW